ncbi:MAG: flavodoxin [Muribaculaceae bacterium]|nr:flavodoxin [Muribaculaceae bacterium]
MKTGIFYGSTTGTTADIASRIAKALGVAEEDVHNVAEVRPSELGKYDFIILGSSTWGDGDLQEDWGDFIDAVEAMALDGKKIALFGCGDESMTDTFCNAVGEIYDRVKGTGATIVGAFNTFPYEFNHSAAVKVEGAGAVGLLIDEVNHADVTDKRIAEWVKTL